MSRSGFIRSVSSSFAVTAATLGVIGFANVSFGEAIVGEMRRTEPAPKAAAAINAMKAEYRRPALIPFPKENPYTPEKAALGKKLYFDTRISVTSAQSCARPRHGEAGSALADHCQCRMGSDLHVGWSACGP